MVKEVVAAALALVVWVGNADAGPKRKLRVETNPEGAIVYIDSKENGAACQPTPCTIELPIGETPIIVELLNYETKFATVIVSKRGKIKLDKLALEPAIGTLVIDGPPGASITIDGEDKGKAPARLDVSADTHKVVITKGGKTLFDQYVPVETNEEKPVGVFDLRGGTPTTDTEAPGEGGGVDIDTTDTTDTSGGVTKSTPGPARAPFASIAVAMNVGFRQFTYENNESRDKLRDETESGQVLLGPLIELWPGAMAGVHFLRGLSLMGRFQFRINEQPVTGGGIQNELSTFWQSFEVSARHKWLFGGRYGVEVGAGWTREQYRFNGTPTDKLLVPDAQYEAVRIGVKGSILVDTGGIDIEPYLDLESRIVMSGGPLENRFGPATSVGGLRGALGIVGRYNGIYVRAEAAALRYAWEFESNAMYMASGGTDLIALLGFYAGYAY